MKEILVKTLMTKNVNCLPPEAALHIAVTQMVENRYSCMIIEQNKSPVYGFIPGDDE